MVVGQALQYLAYVEWADMASQPRIKNDRFLWQQDPSRQFSFPFTKQQDVLHNSYI